MPHRLMGKGWRMVGVEQGFREIVIFKELQRWRWDCSSLHSREPHREKDKKDEFGRRARERQTETKRDRQREPVTDRQGKSDGGEETETKKGIETETERERNTDRQRGYFLGAKTKLERKKTMGQMEKIRR